MSKSDCCILGHRGLEPSKSNFFSESSYAAFADQLRRGYGIEFDPAFLADGTIVVVHDSNLSRLTSGKDRRSVSELTRCDIEELKSKGHDIPFFSDILRLIVASGASLNALHLKSRLHQPDLIKALIAEMGSVSGAKDRILIFDVTRDAAEALKKLEPNLRLAPSVAHPFDIERYNSCVGGTLLSIEQVAAMRELFDWVWLDEWDRLDAAGGEKTFYSAQTFEVCRSLGLKIALVTPELHGTSPGLLAGEAHADASSYGRLMSRIAQIIALAPDAICTDYPDKTRSLLG